MLRKRAFDLVVLVLASVVWVPVLLIASLGVLVFSGRPIYYRSVRRVSRNALIPVVKFRAMVRNAEKLANRETVPVTNTRFLNIPPDSPLYTPVGRMLEKLGLTELPQMLLVLRGSMTLVGSRPLPENVMDCLRDEYSNADDRFLVRAGLTGPAQLVGRQELTDSERLTLEGAYCRAVLRGYTFRMDFLILLNTVLIVARLRPAFTYNGVLDLLGHATEPHAHAKVAGAVNAAVAGASPSPVRRR